MSSESKVLSLIRDNLDGILALGGAIFSLVLVAYLHTHVGHLAYTATGIFCFVACVSYLVLRYRQKLLPVSSILDLRTSASVLLLFDLAFFVLFIYSLWSFAFRPEPYVRPLVYFISIAAMSAILAAKILFLTPKNSAVSFALFQIILIALSLEWSVLILFPSIVGADTWYHQSITMTMLDEGYIVESYQGLPIMQLAVGTTSLITALNYKMALMLSISFLQVVCDTLFVFLIGRLIFNAKIGMLAALLVGVANWHIFFGYWTTPIILGATFVIIILYLLLNFHRDRIAPVIPICALLMAALILTHAMAALWLSILILVLWLGFTAYNRFFKQRLAGHRFLVVGLLFTAVMLSWWTFGTAHTHTLVVVIRGQFQPGIGLTYAPGTAPSEVTPAAWETLSGAPYELLFNSFGMFLFLALSLIGCFHMLSKRFGTPYSFFMAIAGVLILSIGYFPMLIGWSVLEHRWWYMAQILLSVPLAVGFYLLSGLFKKKYLKAGLVIVLIFVLTFLSIIGLPSNQTNRTFSKNQIVRFGFTTSELEALHSVSANYEDAIGMDAWYSVAGNTPGLFINMSEGRPESIQSCILTKDFSECRDQMLLIRDEIVSHPIGTGSGNYYKLNYDPRQFLTQQGFSRVYNSNSVSGFVR